MDGVKTGNWREFSWERLYRGVEQAILPTGTEAMSCMLHRIENGHEVRPRTHESEQLVLILAGECDYYVAGRSYRLTAGSWLTIPADAEHYIYVYDSTEPCVEVVVCAPACPPLSSELPDFVAAILTSEKASRQHDQ